MTDHLSRLWREEVNLDKWGPNRAQMGEGTATKRYQVSKHLTGAGARAPNPTTATFIVEEWDVGIYLGFILASC